MNFETFFKTTLAEISDSDVRVPAKEMVEISPRTFHCQQAKSDQIYAICEQHDKLFNLLKALNGVINLFIGFIFSVSLLEVFLTTYHIINPTFKTLDFIILIILVVSTRCKRSAYLVPWNRTKTRV